MKNSKNIIMILMSTLALTAFSAVAWSQETNSASRFIQIAATTQQERSAIANLGVSLEAFRSDSVWGFASASVLKRVQAAGLTVLSDLDYSVGRGGHESMLDFPQGDERFHDYKKTLAALADMVNKNADIARLQKIGKSLEGRDIVAIHINTTPEALMSNASTKPGVIFMGNHHAREHLSLEIPLMLAKYLLDNRDDAKISALLDTRDIWVVPMVNPDGAEFDISTGTYQSWRKNRRDNGDGTFGVDLNRNYGYKWGTGGSDTDTSSDVYMGKEPFSEPETQVMRDFVNAHLNAKVLLTFHTFSELILYPWGHTNDAIDNAKDKQVFEKMATTMADWNHYKPEQSSALYIASGDTTDWAYGEHGIFAFTFELSPNSMSGGGFYPGAGVIDKVFSDNLKPCMYMIDVADDPYKVLDNSPSGFLTNYVEPRLPEALLWKTNPI